MINQKNWLAVNLIIFSVTMLFTLLLVPEVLKYKEKDWYQDITRMFSCIIVLMSSSAIIAYLAPK